MFIHVSKSYKRPARMEQDGHLIPSSARGTRSDIRFARFLLLVLLLPATGLADDTPAWARRSISGITSTNAPPPAQTRAPAPDPARAALDQLTHDEVPAPAEEWGLAPDRRIAEFGEYRPVDDAATVEERMEQTRIRLIIEEAELLARRQEYDAAVHMLESAKAAVAYDSSRFTLHRRLGAMAFRMQRYEEAARHMREALALQPNDSATASNLAAAQMTMGDLDDALETLQGIQLGMIQNRQLLFSVHFNMACLLSMKDRKEEALDSLYKAADSDPPSAFASLGDPQLDPIRSELRFRELKFILESLMSAPQQ